MKSAQRVSIWPVLGGVLVLGWVGMSRPSGIPAGEPLDPTGEPVQETTVREPFRAEGFRLFPRAEYDIAARVAGVARYRFDRWAPLAPVDAVLAWGALTGPPYQGRVSYDQIGRYYFWSTRARNLDLHTIRTRSANVHLAPATDNLHRLLVRLDPGDRVRFRGLLVDAIADDGAQLRTSVTRSDTGPGACELLWVEEARVGDTLYR